MKHCTKALYRNGGEVMQFEHCPIDRTSFGWHGFSYIHRTRCLCNISISHCFYNKGNFIMLYSLIYHCFYCAPYLHSYIYYYKTLGCLSCVQFEKKLYFIKNI